jgi:type I restriction enzyme S subunit
MINGLKPYLEYKESEVPWLGHVPGHWDVVPSKALFRHRKDKARIEDQMLTASQSHGIISRNEFMAIEGRRVMQVITGKEILKHVEPNDFVMSMRSFQGGLEWSRIGGAISSAYVMLVPQADVYSPYFARLFKCTPYITALRKTSDLVRDGQALRFANFGQIHLPLPPPDEQAAIVKFLDYANGKIERAIRAKRKLIGLLNEQKQAIIHRAVTRGLDPNVKLKPSGIPWLGDVPEHWEVRRAKYLFKEVDERSKTGEEELLSVSHITGVTPRSEKNITMFKAASYVGSKMCRPDDLVINTMWAWMAALGSSTRHGIVSSAYGVYRPLRQRVIFGRYIEALLHTPHYMADILFRSTGIRASRLRLYPEEFLKMPVTLPPYEEQVAMFQWADSETKHLSSAIVRADHEIELLQEYRTTLTAEVVTGKLDVREAAKRLPDQTDEPLPPDESLEDLVDDEITEEDEA